MVAHKGCARFRLRTHGKAAHSSVPHEGDNAIYQMAKVLGVMKDDIEGGLAGLDHPLVGPPTIVVAAIRGGTQINIVPEECAIDVDRRVIPGEDAGEVLNGIQGTLRERLENSNVDFDIEELLLDWPLDTAPESAIVRLAQQVAASMGLEDRLHGVAYGSDASKLQQLKGVPSIVFGPGSIAQAHSREEWVPVEQVGRAADFYVALARGFGQGEDDA